MPPPDDAAGSCGWSPPASESRTSSVRGTVSSAWTTSAVVSVSARHEDAAPGVNQ
ncbi:hypothetical protein LO772_33930 [Yinghuangia sp. ASG 101]|uniref:hypothetical protein n=1 Tax=Yinghuangia sp. ASG 101 TaxID=2896848 RepID=UPI001E582731|nr:hypothetical protein [Yinghuangia sp. ASG 101]UGQ11713.1 hypothetical protein LO772_33930 [Yinghuangia sp. ASG 101]